MRASLLCSVFAFILGSAFSSPHCYAPSHAHTLSLARTHSILENCVTVSNKFVSQFYLSMKLICFLVCIILAKVLFRLAISLFPFFKLLYCTLLFRFLYFFPLPLSPFSCFILPRKVFSTK